MTEIEWEDAPRKGNEKYPPLLRAIKGEQLASSSHREQWAKLTAFENANTARDLADRLKRKHDEFNFITRTIDNETIVYARLKEGVTE